MQLILSLGLGVYSLVQGKATAALAPLPGEGGISLIDGGLMGAAAFPGPCAIPALEHSTERMQGDTASVRLQEKTASVRLTNCHCALRMCEDPR